LSSDGSSYEYNSSETSSISEESKEDGGNDGLVKIKY